MKRVDSGKLKKAGKQHKLLKDQEKEDEVEQKTWKTEEKNVWRICTQ